jgi:hypothetical protein
MDSIFEIEQTGEAAMIVQAILLGSPEVPHNFVDVIEETGKHRERHCIYFRNIRHPEPPIQELIGMNVSQAKRFLKEDEARATHE